MVSTSNQCRTLFDNPQASTCIAVGSMRPSGLGLGSMFKQKYRQAHKAATVEVRRRAVRRGEAVAVERRLQRHRSHLRTRTSRSERSGSYRPNSGKPHRVDHLEVAHVQHHPRLGRQLTLRQRNRHPRLHRRRSASPHQPARVCATSEPSALLQDTQFETNAAHETPRRGNEESDMLAGLPARVSGGQPPFWKTIDGYTDGVYSKVRM